MIFSCCTKFSVNRTPGCGSLLLSNGVHSPYWILTEAEVVFDHCAFPRLHFLSVTKFGAKHCSPAELWPKTEIQYGGRCRLEFTFSCPFGHVIPVNVMFCICKSNYQILWKSDFRMIRRLKVAVQISCQSLCDFFVSLA